MAPSSASAAEHVHCEVRYASQTWQVDARPTDEPLRVPSVDIGQRFAFKAVARGTPGHTSDRITQVSLYAYDLEAEGAPALVHQQRLSPPFATGTQVPALTGWQHVHSSVLGRELVYGCALRQDDGAAAVPSQPPTQAQTQAHIPAPPQPAQMPDASSPDASPAVRLVFLGDVMLADGPGRLIARGGDPFAPVAARLKQADVRIANLECVVASTGKAFDKPWTFLAHPRVLGVLKRHVDVVSVANNHSGDFGRAAFAEMLQRLHAAGLPHIGGGRDLASAHAPHLIVRDGLKIALLGYDEFFPRHFEAGHDHPGVAWSEDEQVVDDIRRARSVHGADIVIPFMHWGQEHEPLANARQRQLARLMIDAGADAVVGTHPHVVQDTETYRGKPIVYSLGNFVFDGFSSLDNRTGWMLFMTVGREGVRQWHTEAVRTDVDGTPWPVPLPPGASAAAVRR
ncbi:CapA family protein [Aquabacterium sp.]|uniref:CapA family protein n=1 Tax=Aquabacterium sp. TaxID=1872578 RepID=UPI0025BF9619|nr:CapA family protein [Aquabacterium sp.]